MTPRARVLMLIMFIILGGGLLYLHVLTRRVARETPTYAEEVARTRLNEAALESAATAPMETVTLYFPAYGRGGLVAEERKLAWAEAEVNRIRQILLALIEGSHQGHSRGLPPSATIRTVFLTSDGTAYIDFTGEGLVGLHPGIGGECLAVYSIVNSLAGNIPAVQRVKILVQGQEVETLGGHADLSDFIAPDPSRVLPAS